jgi:hypothetical protein
VIQAEYMTPDNAPLWLIALIVIGVPVVGYALYRLWQRKPPKDGPK